MSDKMLELLVQMSEELTLANKRQIVLMGALSVSERKSKDLQPSLDAARDKICDLEAEVSRLLAKHGDEVDDAAIPAVQQALAGAGAPPGHPPRPGSPVAGAFASRDDVCPTCGCDGGAHFMACPRVGGPVSFSFDGIFSKDVVDAKQAAGRHPQPRVDDHRFCDSAHSGDSANQVVRDIEALADQIRRAPRSALHAFLTAVSASTDGSVRHAMGEILSAPTGIHDGVEIAPDVWMHPGRGAHTEDARNSAERARDGDGEGLFYCSELGFGYCPGAGEDILWLSRRRGDNDG